MCAALGDHKEVCGVVRRQRHIGIRDRVSTASMIRSGKTYQNLMIDVNASNKKLYARAIRIVMQATECDYSTAEQALIRAKNQTKLASLMVLTGLDVNQAESALITNKGFLRKAVEQQGS